MPTTPGNAAMADHLRQSRPAGTQKRRQRCRAVGVPCLEALGFRAAQAPSGLPGSPAALRPKSSGSPGFEAATAGPRCPGTSTHRSVKIRFVVVRSGHRTGLATAARPSRVGVQHGRTRDLPFPPNLPESLPIGPPRSPFRPESLPSGSASAGVVLQYGHSSRYCRFVNTPRRVKFWTAVRAEETLLRGRWHTGCVACRRRQRA